MFTGGWLDDPTTGSKLSSKAHIFFIFLSFARAGILEEVFKIFASRPFCCYLYSDCLRNNTVDWHLRTFPHSVYPIAKHTGDVHGSDVAECIKENWYLYIFSTLKTYVAISEKDSVRKVCM